MFTLTKLLLLVFVGTWVPQSLAKFKNSNGDEKQGKNDWFKNWKDSYQGELDEPRRMEKKAEIIYSLRDTSDGSWKVIKRGDPQLPPNWVKEGHTKILVHGYGHNPNADPNKQIKEQNLLEIVSAYESVNKSINIILMNWMSLGAGKYRDVVTYVPYAGQDLAEFLANMTNAGHLKMKSVHVIAFAMGGHVAGVAGDRVGPMVGGKKINRITGMDPSGIGFDAPGGSKYLNNSVSLDKNDAKFVDIIHCNMGSNMKDVDEKMNEESGRFGTAVKAGHADFYVNKGSLQTRYCQQSEETRELACSQKRGPIYFAESITNQYVACPCDDPTQNACECTMETKGEPFGDPCRATAAGKYYVRLPPKQEKGGKVDDD